MQYTRLGNTGLVVSRQLEDNLGAVDLELADEEMRTLDELSPHSPYYPSWFTATLSDATVTRALQR